MCVWKLVSVSVSVSVSAALYSGQTEWMGVGELLELTG